MKQQGSKTTSQMISLIRKADNMENFFQENDASFVDIRFSDYLYSLLEERHMIPADLIEMTSIDRSYIYHIMAGNRLPSRETILELIFVLQLNLDTAQHLLRLAGRPILYSRNRRDAAIIFCIHKKRTLEQVNRQLQALGFPTIGNK